MKALDIFLTARAEQSIVAAVKWWRENRADAPNAIREEMERTLTMIAEFPEIGSRFGNASGKRVRRVLLERVHYHLYYCVRKNRIEVLNLWHESRGSRPPI